MKNNYILVCVHERNITVYRHLSYESAYEQMVKELDKTCDDNRENLVIGDDYGLDTFSAWSNRNDNHDWLIEKINDDNDDKDVRESSITSTILQFNFETGDTECQYYQVLAFVQGDDVDYGMIEDSISSYTEFAETEDKEFQTIVEDVLDASGLIWSFMSDRIPESKAIHTFWI